MDHKTAGNPHHFPARLFPTLQSGQTPITREKEMRVNTIVKAAVIAGLLFPAVSANATLTVTPGLAVTNACHTDIAIAVHYKGNRGWSTTSFVSIPAKKTKERIVSSDNSIFYYYAESLSGKIRWAGDKNFPVEGKAYPMKKTTLDWDEERNRYHLRLTCRSA
jgi:uncharacterized membrane protein